MSHNGNKTFGWRTYRNRSDYCESSISFGYGLSYSLFFGD